jgi:hypothetical protein
MDMHAQGLSPRAPTAPALFVLAGALLGALVFASGCIAPALDTDRHGSSPAAGRACGACGVVEAVRTFDASGERVGVPRGVFDPGGAGAVSGLQLSGARAEGMLLLFGALAGHPVAPRPVAMYEVTVRHSDGSVRVLFESGAPRYRVGERVRVVKGRVEPLS